MGILYSTLAIFIIFAGNSLLLDLGAGRVPSRLKPVANLLVRAGYDPKWVIVAMWGAFAILSFALLVLIGIPLVVAVVDLGTVHPST